LAIILFLKPSKVIKKLNYFFIFVAHKHKDMSLKFNIQNEINTLQSVVLGRADSNGPAPTPEQCYDPKSREHALAGTYPKEADMIKEMAAFEAVLKKHNVRVYRPDLLENVNQIFTRDIGFVIEDKFIKANILPDREAEFQAINPILDNFDCRNVVQPPEEVHVEGGDVMPWNEYIFVGTYRYPDYPDYITARTNAAAVDFLQQTFPHKKVIAFDLKKSNTEAKENALHLDCVFQPVGKGKAIIHREGFLVEEQYQFLVDLFGKENMFHINKDEMYNMFSNVFSISPEVVVSEQGATRLNKWLREQGLTVEEVPYAEISKQEGLLRCSTLPLQREK
jgi:N-dimethylarginine dimethylaminohydrolase